MTVATAAVATTERKRPAWRPSRIQAVLALSALSALGTLLAARVSAFHLPPLSGSAPSSVAAQPANVAATATGAQSPASRLAAAEGERAAQAAAIGRLSASIQAAARAGASLASSSEATAQQIQLPPLPALPPVTVSRASGG